MGRAGPVHRPRARRRRSTLTLAPSRPGPASGGRRSPSLAPDQGLAARSPGRRRLPMAPPVFLRGHGSPGAAGTARPDARPGRAAAGRPEALGGLVPSRPRAPPPARAPGDPTPPARPSRAARLRSAPSPGRERGSTRGRWRSR